MNTSPDTLTDVELVEQLPFPVIWLNERNQIKRLNMAAENLLQKSCPTRSAHPITSADDPTLRWLEHELLLFAGLPDLECSFEKERRCENDVCCFQVTLKHLLNAEKEKAGTIIALIDITPQKRLADGLSQAHGELERRVAERTAELARANASLRRYITECNESAAALKKLSSVVEQTADHVIITDRFGAIEYVNPAFEKLTGFSKAEVIGRTPRILKSGKHDAAFFQNLWKAILAGEIFRAEVINKKKNGELYVEDKVIAPIKDEGGHITHFVSTGRVISERRRPGES